MSHAITFCGLLYESKDELLVAMEQILNNRAYRDRMGAAARVGYAEAYTDEAHLTRYLELVRELQ